MNRKKKKQSKFLSNLKESNSASEEALRVSTIAKASRLANYQTMSVPFFVGKEGYLGVLEIYDRQLLDRLECIAINNSYVMRAIVNAMSLCATKYRTDFPSVKSESLLNKYSEIVRDGFDECMNGLSVEAVLIPALVRQICLGGAISAQIVPDNTLTFVKDVAMIEHSTIYFALDTKESTYKPYQLSYNRRDGLGNSVELSTYLFKYIPFIKSNDNPYGIPLYLTAIGEIPVSDDIKNNMKYILKKYGVLGFLEVLLKQPSPVVGETNEEYVVRLEKLLDANAEALTNGVSNGLVVGFENQHTFNYHEATTSPTGFKEFADTANRGVFNSLHQDALMFGSPENIGETLGRALLSLVSANFERIQAIVAEFLADLASVIIFLKTREEVKVKITFNTPAIGDTLRDTQRRTSEIANVVTLLHEGIISRRVAANELGYQDSFLEEAPVIQDVKAPAPKGGNRDRTVKPTTGFSVAEEGCCSYADDKPTTEELDYLSRVSKVIEETSREILSQVLEDIKNGATLDEAVSSLDNALATHSIVNEMLISKISASLLRDLYTQYKNNHLPLYGGSQVSFTLRDERTIKFWEKHDDFYLGKRFLQEQVRKDLLEEIKSLYLNESLKLNDRKALVQLQSNFNQISVEGLGMIVATTVSSLKNYSTVNAFDELGIEYAEIVGVSDRLQCAYCRDLQGVRFPVKQLSNLISEAISGSPVDLPNNMPFANKVFKEGVKGVTVDLLLASKVGCPPFHPKCRDILVYSE